MPDDRRPIVISCGEPAGVGPEIAAAAWAALGDRIPLAELRYWSVHRQEPYASAEIATEQLKP